MKFLASHESSTRGTFDFPIELYYVDKMHPRYEMPFHWHMEFELMLVLSGEFSLLIDSLSSFSSGRRRSHSPAMSTEMRRCSIGPQKREPSMPFPSGIASSQRGIGPVKLMLQCFGGSISVLLTYSILFSP